MITYNCAEVLLLILRLSMDTYLALAMTSATPLPFNADTTVHNLQREREERIKDYHNARNKNTCLNV